MTCLCDMFDRDPHIVVRLIVGESMFIEAGVPATSSHGAGILRRATLELEGLIQEAVEAEYEEPWDEVGYVASGPWTPAHSIGIMGYTKTVAWVSDGNRIWASTEIKERIRKCAEKGILCVEATHLPTPQ